MYPPPRWVERGRAEAVERSAEIDAVVISFREC